MCLVWELIEPNRMVQSKCPRGLPVLPPPKLSSPEGFSEVRGVRESGVPASLLCRTFLRLWCIPPYSGVRSDRKKNQFRYACFLCGGKDWFVV